MRPPPFTRSLAVALGVSAGWLAIVAVIAAVAGDLVGISVLAGVGAVMAAACGVATWRTARRLEVWLGEQLKGTAQDLERSPGAPVFPEPEVESAMAVPFSSRGQLLGVVAVYGHTAGETFGPDDLEALVTLVAQAGTAVDNVSLHEEARRLSITDGLTGLWNR